jgi:catechol 2,3-dioxygenase-like lactoylglutathione lyase family enzyme
MCCDFKGKVVGMKAISGQEEFERFERQRQRISEQYLHTSDPRPASSAQGLHHVAFLSSDVERTVQFYRELLEFPLTAIAENRDYRGSFHFFFDIGNNNLLAFFDFPGLHLGPYQEMLGGLHHVAISVEPMRWERRRDRLIAANVELREHGDVSIYFQDPDGTRLELIAYPLGKKVGAQRYCRRHSDRWQQWRLDGPTAESRCA